MIKKVIDIIPPNASRASARRSVAGECKAFTEHAKESKTSEAWKERTYPLCQRKKLIFKKPTFILLVLILIGIFSYAYFVLPRVEIKIWPGTELLTIKTELIVGREIPGEILESTERIDQKFFSSDRFLRKTRAEGMIRLYNNYSTASQVLIPHTRFISACGKTFRTPVRVVIPGKRHEAGRWVPGTRDVRVVAYQPGDEFNISPTAFSIPGLAGLARFAAIYGRSYEPMTGGEIREIVRVSQKDLDLAKDILTEKAVEGCSDVLKINQGISILKKAVKVDILESSADVEVKAEVEEFVFQVKAKCRTIAFKIDDMRKFALDFITDQLPENRLIAPESFKIDYSLESIDIDEGEMILYLDLAADIYSAIDQFTLRKELTGKSLTEVRIFLENLPQTDKVYVNFWPFWVESAPKNLDRIKFELRFDLVRN